MQWSSADKDFRQPAKEAVCTVTYSELPTNLRAVQTQQKPHYTTADTSRSKLEVRVIAVWASVVIAAVFALTGAYFWGASNASVTEVEILIPTPAPVIVQVVGEVNAPGVYELNAQDRVLTAIEVAGGVTEFADIESTNLAAVVKDGARISVPRVPSAPVSELSNPIDSASGDTNIVSPSTSTSANGANLEQIDLNTATIDQLMSLPGIGQTRANQIIEYRSAVGRFSTLEELLEVNGIGEKTLETIRSRVVVQ